MIDLHIPRIVPYRKEEVVFDHKFLGTDEMGYAKELLGIVHGGAIRRQAKILEDAGMSIDRFTLGSYGPWQRILNDYKSEINPNDIYLLLDVDSTFTDFIIFSHENLLFTRSIAVGANEMMENMQASLKKLLSDARQSLIIFYSEELNRKPVKIFISGADVLNEMYRSIETELSIPVKSVTLPYSEDMVKAKGRTIPHNLSLSAVTEIAVEESQKGLTFILPEIQIRKSLKEKTRELTIMGTLIIYILTMSLAIFLGRSYNQQSYLKILNQNNQLIEADVGELLGQSKKIEFVKSFIYKRKLPLALLYELQKIVPKEIAINFVSLDESNSVILRGQGAQLADVFKFVTTLENSIYLEGVSTKYTRTKKVKEKEVTDFEINFKIGASANSERAQAGSK
ncbi:MAG: PilN domain-containing protein, partial [Candidatus Omnitrophota bacterium]|jgi:hypothetical protein